VVSPLLDGVESFEWRFMGRDREWHDTWPPLTTAQMPPDELPRAAEVVITLDGGAEIRRVFFLDAR
jgi:type II secretion system protein J